MNAKNTFILTPDCDFDCSQTHKIGHIRADNDNYRWWTTYFPADAKDNMTSSIKDEANYLMRIICRLFPKYNDMVRFCESHSEAKLEQSDDSYNFYVMGQAANYWIRCITRFRDYNIYINIFDKT